MTIDWAAFGLVLLVSVVAASLVVTLFATGIRLLATPAPDAGGAGAAARDEETDDAPRVRPLAATVLATALFAVAGAVVLAGVVLIVT